MISIKKIYIVALFVAGFITLQGCSYDALPSQQGTMNQIKTAETFNWGVNKKVTFEIIGANVEVNSKNTFYIKSEDGVGIVAMSHYIKDSFTGGFIIPAGTDKVMVQYGSIKKTYDIYDADKITLNLDEELSSSFQ